MFASIKYPISRLVGMGFFLWASAGLAEPDLSTPSDDLIVIDEGPEQEPDKAQKLTVWQDIKDHAYVRTDIFVRGAYQLTNPIERPVRLLGSIWGSAGLEPADYFSLQLSLIGRVPVDISWQPYANQPAGSADVFIDFNDTYAKVEHSNFAFYIGSLLLPWGATRAAALTDRLNPTDYRRGQDFQTGLLGRIPQWGILGRTSVWSTSIEGVFLFNYTPSKGGLSASDQNGAQIARYQGALMPTLTQMGDLLPHDRSMLEAVNPLFLTPQFGLRLRRQLTDLVDAGFNVNFSYNEVPTLNFSQPVASFLANRYLEGFGGGVPTSFADWPCANAGLFAGRQELDRCVGGAGVLSHSRVLAFGADVSLNLGAVLLKGDLLVEPKFGNSFGGKTAILVSRDKLRSMDLSSMAVAIAVDGEYGDWFTGSVELFNVTWFNVPKNERLLGVESFTSNADDDRAVNRLALAAAIEGSLFSQRVLWRLRGEAGVLEPDVLASLDLRHEWQPIGFYLGGYLNGFVGVEGSPGWMRQNATAFGVYVGHKL